MRVTRGRASSAWSNLTKASGVLPLLIAWAVAGCGGESGNDSGTRVAIKDLPAGISDAICQAFNRCYGSVFDIAQSGEDCRKRTRDQIADSLADISSAISAGRAVYHDDKVQACLDAVKNAGCDAGLKFNSSVCLAALDGTAELGADCSADQDCKGTAFCKSEGTCPGHCTARGGPGAACETNDQCDTGLSCPTPLRRCAEQSEKGQPCGAESGHDCKDGLACTGADAAHGTPGTCTAVNSLFTAHEGQSCGFQDGPLCAAGLSCVVKSIQFTGGQTDIVSECAAPVASGKSCSFGVPDQCPPDEYCKFGAALQVTGTCTAKPKAGEACVIAGSAATGAAEICAPYTRCDNGICRDLAAIGSECHSDGVCLSGSCAGGKCVLGGACE